MAEEVKRSALRIGEPAVFQTARSAANALSASLLERMPTLTVRVLPFDANARIAVDGSKEGHVAAAPLQLDPGTHRLQVEAPGYSPATRRVTLAAGDETQLDVVLTPLWQARTAPAPVPSAPEPASRSAEPAPVLPQSPEPAPVVPADDAVAEADAARIRAYVGFGVGGAAALTWSVTGLLAFATKPDCDAAGCVPSQRGDHEQSLRFGNIANVSFVVAALGLVYGWWQYPSTTVAGASTARLEIVPRSSNGVEARLSTTF